MTIAEHEAWKEFKAKMAKHKVSTIYAARALLVQEYVQQELARKEGEQDSASSSTDESAMKSHSTLLVKVNAPERSGLLSKFHTSISELNDELVCQPSVPSIFAASNAKPVTNRHVHPLQLNRAASTRNIYAATNENIAATNRAIPRRNSYAFGQMASIASSSFNENALFSSDSKARRQEFNKMVGGVVGKQEPMVKRTRTIKKLASFDMGAFLGCQSSVDASLHASFSFSDEGDGFSSYISTYAAESNGTKSEKGEQHTVNLDTEDVPTRSKLQRSLNASVKKLFVSSTCTVDTHNLSHSNLGGSDVYDRHEDNAKPASVNEEMLVKFPSKPRINKHQSCSNLFIQNNSDNVPDDTPNRVNELYPAIICDLGEPISSYVSDISDDEGYKSSQVVRATMHKQQRRSSTGGITTNHHAPRIDCPFAQHCYEQVEEVYRDTAHLKVTQKPSPAHLHIHGIESPRRFEEPGDDGSLEEDAILAGSQCDPCQKSSNWFHEFDSDTISR